MRRTYISPEFQYKNVYGTFNMLEQSSFFGSKMLEIDDTINISTQNIIYYQTLSNEQIDISVENSLPSIVYIVPDDKKANHTLSIDKAQPDYQKEKNTKWIIEIDLNTILSNFIFATMKQHRTFEGVKNVMTVSNDVNTSIYEYIKKNVLNRYKYTSIDMYIKYRSLNNQNILRFKNDWNVNINQAENKTPKIQTETAFDDSTLKILFNQEQPSDQYSFEYYFDLMFEKI